MKSQKQTNSRDEINKVVEERNISEDDFKLVRLSRYEQILVLIVDRFTSLNKTNINAWWWNYFAEPVYSCRPKSAFESLIKLIDEDELVWFVVEDERKAKEHFWLYEGKINSITTVLGELPYREYYLVSKELEWIICENHHNLLIGSGEAITSRMKLLEKQVEI